MWFGGLIVFSGVSARSKFISVKGPGLVYIDMKQSKMFFKKDQLSLYVMLLFAMLYISMFLVILFDRRDPMAMAPPAPPSTSSNPEPSENQNSLISGLFNF